MQRRSTYTEGRGIGRNYYFDAAYEDYWPSFVYTPQYVRDPTFWDRSFVYPFAIEGMGSQSGSASLFTWIIIILIVILLFWIFLK